MDEMKYTKLAEITGRSNADMIESFLEAEGIDVELVQESVTHTTYVTPFALVQVFVPKDQLEQARELLKGFDEGLPTVEDEDDSEE